MFIRGLKFIIVLRILAKRKNISNNQLVTLHLRIKVTAVFNNYEKLLGEKGNLDDTFDPALNCIPSVSNQDLMMEASLKIKPSFVLPDFGLGHL